jgi:hypothetical protein
MEGIHWIYGTLYKPGYLGLHWLVYGVKNWKLSQIFYNFFSHNLKCHREFFKPSKLMDTKGDKILKNIKVCWISMLRSTKWVFSEYKTLLAKMVGNAYENFQAQINFDSSCDVPIFLGLACLMSLSKMHQLNKFS